MLDLLTPTDHAGAYEWASVFLAHFTLGLGLTAIVAALLDLLADEWTEPGDLAPALVTFCYLVIWEGLVQRYGAGLTDAALDTFAVGIGGLSGLLLWRRKGAALGIVLAIGAFVLWRGVERRK